MSDDFLTKVRNKPEEEKKSLLVTYSFISIIVIIIIAIILNNLFGKKQEQDYSEYNSTRDLKVFVSKIVGDFESAYQQILSK